MKIPAECMWFDCPCRVAMVSQSISRAAENYPGFPPPQDGCAKCVFRSRIAWFDVDSVSKEIYKFHHKSQEILGGEGGGSVDHLNV